MGRVWTYSLILVAGLAGSQLIGLVEPALQAPLRAAIQWITMACLAFIMIRVGFEFDIDRTRLRSYAVDYGVAATAAAFPWLFCAAYFVLVLGPEGAVSDVRAWKEALLAGRFAAPTSAGVLFAMLAAAGLSATWLFRKARVLAIFDDLDTVLLMIPLKIMMVGWRWQLAVVVLVMGVLLALAWRFMHRLRLPVTPRALGAWAVGIALASEALYRISKGFDATVPVHIEVLLPAFVLGCILARPRGADGRELDAHAALDSQGGASVAHVVACVFMAAVGLSMPALFGPGSSLLQSPGWPGWGAIGLHVLAITLLSNLGKMFPLFCYRSEANWRERLALCVGMFPRGEVGAGVLVVSMAYGVGETLLAVAVLSLAANLLLTGAFIAAVRGLVLSPGKAPAGDNLAAS